MSATCASAGPDGLVCSRPLNNHPSCTGFDDEIDDFRDWDNPAYVDPRPADPETAKAVKAKAMAGVAPDVRVGGFQAGLEASEAASEAKWSDEDRALVYQVIVSICQERAFRPDGEPGHDEFSSDLIWERLAGRVRWSKALTSVLMKASRAGWCDTTGKTVISQRGGEHDRGQRLSLWYSLAGRQ